MKAVSALDLYKATPRTNCKECSFPTCMAFATRVIVEKKPLDTCPYLSEEDRESLGQRIHEQQEAGVYVKRDQYKITADYIREKIEDYDLAAIAPGLGAEYLERDGQPFLRLSYLNRECLLSKEEVFIQGQTTRDHWDNILLYNYVHFSGSEPLHGEWIPIDNIPGHIPKKPGLEHGCEEKIAHHYEGKRLHLKGAAEILAGEFQGDASHADAAFTFFPPPKVPFYLPFWDHVPEEGFTARAKVLFDRSVTSYLDIESLVFLAEKFADVLIDADQNATT